MARFTEALPQPVADLVAFPDVRRDLDSIPVAT